MQKEINMGCVVLGKMKDWQRQKECKFPTPKEKDARKSRKC